MDQFVSRIKKIDGDSHFMPPVDFTAVAERAGIPESAVQTVLRDATVFTDRNARAGGLKATSAGKKAGVGNIPGAAGIGAGGPIGHGDPAKRVELLPETGFDMQVLIPDGIYSRPFGSPIGGEHASGIHLALSMAYNNAAAAAQRDYPEQLIACGIVPFGGESLEDCIDEAKRAVAELGVKALMINSNWRGANWDSFELYPFWDVMNELDVPIYVHGNPFTCRVSDHVPTNFTVGWERMRRLHISNYLGFGFEYMLCMASLTLGGLLKDFPNLRFAFFEAGASWLPWVMYTLDRVYGIEGQCARCEMEPSTHIRETCMVAAEPDETTLVGAIESIGSKNFILGSDYPHAPSTYPNTVAGLLAMDGLNDDSREDILGGNLYRLFKM